MWIDLLGILTTTMFIMSPNHSKSSQVLSLLGSSSPVKVSSTRCRRMLGLWWQGVSYWRLLQAKMYNSLQLVVIYKAILRENHPIIKTDANQIWRSEYFHTVKCWKRDSLILAKSISRYVFFFKFSPRLVIFYLVNHAEEVSNFTIINLSRRSHQSVVARRDYRVKHQNV